MSGYIQPGLPAICNRYHRWILRRRPDNYTRYRSLPSLRPDQRLQTDTLPLSRTRRYRDLSHFPAYMSMWQSRHHRHLFCLRHLQELSDSVFPCLQLYHNSHLAVSSSTGFSELQMHFQKTFRYLALSFQVLSPFAVCQSVPLLRPLHDPDHNLHGMYNLPYHFQALPEY